jgi:xylulokinase
MRFTGVASASPASMTAAWLTDNRHPGGTAYDEDLVRRAGVNRAKLPPLVPTGSVLGPVSAAVAAELGLAPSAVVVAGVPDLHGTALGAGCVQDYETHLAIGTTGWVSCPVPRKKTDLFRQLASVPGLSPDRYLLADNQESAGRCLQWFRDEVLACARPGGRAPSYDEITAMAATAPAGAGGVVFTPWLAGERSPVADRAARGGFHNLSLASDAPAMARAVLEGVALNARWLLEGADRFTGQRLDPLRIVGGGAQSRLWCQVVADVCGRVVERVADPLLTGLRGTALLAGHALGEVDWAEVRSLVPVDATFAPDARTRDVHDRSFAEFPGLYRRQRRMFARLNR